MPSKSLERRTLYMQLLPGIEDLRKVTDGCGAKQDGGINHK